MKVSSGKIQLTMKSVEDRQAEVDLKQSGAVSVSSRRSMNTLEDALAKMGYKHSLNTQSKVRKTAVSSLACTLIGAGFVLSVTHAICKFSILNIPHSLMIIIKCSMFSKGPWDWQL